MDDLYKITSITEFPRVEQGGDVVKMHRVRATTQSGQRFEVDVPEDQFTDDQVRAAVHARAELIDGLVEK